MMKREYVTRRVGDGIDNNRKVSRRSARSRRSDIDNIDILSCKVARVEFIFLYAVPLQSIEGETPG